tara:strand:- start:26 stop:646 length:621 start_codon:yes stop_codon:yes gene_type:complete
MVNYKKFSVQLCALCAAVATLFTSCIKEDIAPSPCITGDCNVEMEFPGYEDSNGIHHIDLDFTGDYLPYFAVEAFADQLKPQYEYNNRQVVEARFDSDTYWTIGDSLMVTVNNYDPFNGPYDYSGNLLPNSSYSLILSLFAGIKVNIVQPTIIYFKKDHSRLRTTRIVGPVPPMAVGDTITLYMETFWEAGMDSELKVIQEKFIVE